MQHKHQRNKNKYFKSKDLETRYAPPMFLLYITPILRYQFPNEMISVGGGPISKSVHRWVGGGPVGELVVGGLVEDLSVSWLSVVGRW